MEKSGVTRRKNTLALKTIPKPKDKKVRLSLLRVGLFVAPHASHLEKTGTNAGRVRGVNAPG